MLIIVYTRYPEPGLTKTRLIPCLGAAGAAALQRQMTEHLLSRLRGGPHALRIDYAGATLAKMQDWLGDDLTYCAQTSGDLGQRISASIRSGLRDHSAVCVIGCDIPGISRAHIDTAARRLTHYDVVIGPAYDGGYYLIALTSEHAELFHTIPWGSDAVLTQTRNRCTAQGLRLSLLTPLADVDDAADLPVWEAARA